MELIVLLVLAGVLGYWLAGSKYSKPIDQAGERIGSTTGGWLGSAEQWWKRTFRREKKPAEEVVDAATPATVEAAPAAAKQTSRRHEAAEETPEI